MQPLDPITLAIIAVVVAVVLSALLLLLFTSREEKFEDVLAAQRSEQEAYLVRSAAVKSAKPRKKFSKGKKKYSDDGEVMDEVSEPLVEETIETSHVEEDESGFSPSGKYFMEADPPDDEKVPLAEEKPSTGIVKERPGKKKSKKAALKEEKSSVSEPHVSFDKPREDVEEVVAQLDSASTLENEPGKFEELEIEEQKLPDSNETAASAKKSKSKPKPTKDKGSIQAGEVSAKRLMELVTSSNLNSSEIQAMIDVLLNKQGENSQWKKSTSKGDTVELLKKQLQEKDNQILEERQQSQNAANKLRELRDELQQEKQKQKHQQTNASNKITAQGKEIQALHARIQASHENHAIELKNMQSQMRQLQEMVTSSSMGNLQRLQEENAQLKNASMRAAQLTADKESLTTELTKLQQSYRHVKGDLAGKMEQLAQTEANRKSAEEKIRQMSVHQNSAKEAENALSKRLSEVNEELNKSQARNSSLQQDLSGTKQLLKAEEAKSAELSERMKGLTATDSSLNSLTAKLQEATARVSELENTLNGFENQLKDSQEMQMQKDQEIQAKELKLAKEQVQTSVANHVNSTPPAENGKEPEVSSKVQEDALKVKEDVIAELHGNVLKKDEEIASLKSLLDEQKNKNNELRQKNWKAMEALSEAEKSAQVQITKALEAAKVANDSMANGQTALIKEKDDSIEKLQADLKEKKEEFDKLEKVVQQQKEKNNELREKNWKAMDALSEMEKNVNNKVKTAVQKIKDENKTQQIEEQNLTKNALCKIHPNVTIDATLPYKSWLEEFEKQASEASSDSKELEELNARFEEVQAQKDNLTAECAHYKVTLQETETLLRKLEDNVESEMDNWQKIVERTQRELKEANDRISSLEEDLQKAKGSAASQSEMVASLEERLEQAKAAENEAKERFTELQEQLKKSTVSEEDANKIKELEKELEVLRAQKKELAETKSKLELTEKDMLTCKKQLENAAKELADRDSELAASTTELAKVQGAEEELKKKVASLEEALTKANNDLGKSQESLDSLNNSPDKKKKGLKGAFTKVMSKKEKEKDDKQLEEAQRKISQQQTEIDDLRNAREKLEKQNKALEVEYTELKRRSVSIEAEMTKSQQIEKDLVEAMSDTALSPVKPRVLPSERKAEFHGTLTPADNFDPGKDAEALRKAMAGSGSDKDAIVAVLGARTNKQRQEIAAKYQQKYGKNLTDDLKSELSGKFEDAIVSMLLVPESHDAIALHDAMSGIGTDEQVLVEILSSRSTKEIEAIKSAYTQIYSGKDVAKKLKEDTGGDFRTVLMTLLEKKPDSSGVNTDLATDDAKKLFEAGEGKKGTDKAVFVEIFTTRNYQQLQATFDAYKNLAKKDILDYITDQIKGDLGSALRAIVRCAQSPPLYFAELLEKALDKSNSKTVTRVMVTRAEVDLAQIRTEFEKKTGQSLKDVVVKKMKGDLEKLLLQLLGN
ncbi:unnamed protein product [Porites lobata]|uniref:Annexin n=1 Tax=Porites lobata TaxID=104759 RepID=A0ABN8PPI5_9CNID|nr:unnamed protein product [Porites lobata]